MAKSSEVAFTVTELRRMIAIECTRADTSFIKSQISARTAMARDLVPGAESIATAHLEIERVEIQFSLVALRLSWWRRALGLWRIWSGEVMAPAPQLFRFAAADEQALNVSFMLRRRGRKLEVESDGG